MLSVECETWLVRHWNYDLRKQSSEINSVPRGEWIAHVHRQELRWRAEIKNFVSFVRQSRAMHGYILLRINQGRYFDICRQGTIQSLATSPTFKRGSRNFKWGAKSAANRFWRPFFCSLETRTCYTGVWKFVLSHFVFTSSKKVQH